MVLNALVSNDDDHPRNHALIAWSAEGWRLSPLFDVVPHPRPESLERDLAMVARKYGRSARRANLVSEAPVFGLRIEEANARVDRFKEIVVGEWESCMSEHGVTPGDRDAIRAAMVPAAFEEPVPRPVV
jgi:serine/threonine-protein kinase HipA